MITDTFYGLLCLFGRHTRGPSEQMWHDGWRYRSACRGCGKPLARTKARWTPQDQL